MISVRPRLLLHLSFLFALVLVQIGRAAGVEDLRKGFLSPPPDSRIMMRWWWFGPAVTKPEIERELRVMKAGGIGGVEVQPVYPLLPDDDAAGIKNLPYLSDEFLDALRFASQKAKDLGMRFDLTLGSGWSFGGAKTSISDAAGQLRVDRVKIPAGAMTVQLPYMIPVEKLLAVFLVDPAEKTGAGPNLKELKDIREASVAIPIDRSQGSEVLFFISSRSGMQVKRPAVGAEGYVIDHLSRTAAEHYLSSTGDRLFRSFNAATVPYSIFSDSLEVYNQDWTDDFLTEFQRRRGYDLKPYLPALVMDIGPKTADVRYDWGRTITELFNDRFMVPVQAWAHRNNTRFRVQAYGLPPAAISSNQWADISDGEGAQWKVVRAARWASSANHAYGRDITSSETWTWLHSPVFRATPLDIKAEADIHFLQGINQLIGHGWAYTPPQVEYPGWRFYAAGIYDEKNPWWIVMPDLAAYLQRMSWLMRQGSTRNDVALYLPNADAYASFTAGKVHLIDVERGLVGEKIMPSIFEAGYNLDFFDDEMLRTIGKPTGDSLSIGSAKHRIVVLPGIERMPLLSLKKLEQFVNGGGILVASRSKPSMAAGLMASAAERAEFRQIANDIFGGSHPFVKFVATDDEVGNALKSMLQPDAAISPSGVDMGVVHRETVDSDIYFVANTSNQKKNVTIDFRTSGHPEIWDAMTGESFALPESERAKLPINFEPYESHVIVFSKQGQRAQIRRNYDQVKAAIDLGQKWSLTLGGGTATQLTDLHSWTDDPRAKNFSGIGTYERVFALPAGFADQGSSVVLDFGEGKALDVLGSRNGMQTWFDPPIREAAVVFLNGVRAGSLWCPPYKIDVTRLLRPGSNTIRIEVGNTALNYMAGHPLPDYKLLNLRYGERFQAQDMDKIQVLPSGIIGTIKLTAMH